MTTQGTNASSNLATHATTHNGAHNGAHALTPEVSRDGERPLPRVGPHDGLHDGPIAPLRLATRSDMLEDCRAVVAARVADLGLGDTTEDYDSLADLFLGKAALDVVALEDVAATKPTPLASVPIEPVDRTHPATNQPVQIQLLQEPRQAIHTNSVSQQIYSHTCTTLAMASTISDRTQPTSRRRIEAVVLGHLPGLAGAWSVQHAKLLANEIGHAVGLIRITATDILVELVWPDKHVGFVQHDLVERVPATLNDALARAALDAGAWMFRVSSSDEHALLQHVARPKELQTTPRIDCITLLTGADDPAIVASYRMIKAWQSQHDSVEFAHALRLTLVEPDEARALQAQTRLRKAVVSFLGCELPDARRLASLSPVRTTTLYAGTCAQGFAEVFDRVGTISDSIAMRPAISPTISPTISPAASPVHPTFAREHTNTERVMRVQPALELINLMPTALMPPAQPQSTSKGSVAPLENESSDHVSPQPSIASAPCISSPTSSPSLTSSSPTPSTSPHELVRLVACSMEISSLAAVGVTCVAAPEVSIAVDQAGHAHLIAFASGSAPLSSAVVSLLAAARWCDQHAELLTRANITPNARDATMHLLTTTPIEARRVIEMGLHVHAMVRVGEAWGAIAIG